MRGPQRPMQLFMDEGGLQNAKSIVFFHDLGSSNQIWRYHMATLRHDFHCLLVSGKYDPETIHTPTEY